MKNLKPLTAAALMLGLAACAPTVLGSVVRGSTVAVPLLAESPLEPVTVLPGKTVYAQFVYPAATVGVAAARYKAMPINFDARETNNEVLSTEMPVAWLNMNVSGLAAGWRLTLEQAYIRKAVNKTINTPEKTEVSYQREVRVVYRITAPEGAVGTQVAWLQFRDGSEDIGTALLMLRTEE